MYGNSSFSLIGMCTMLEDFNSLERNQAVLFHYVFSSGKWSASLRFSLAKGGQRKEKGGWKVALRSNITLALPMNMQTIHPRISGKKKIERIKVHCQQLICISCMYQLKKKSEISCMVPKSYRQSIPHFCLIYFVEKDDSHIQKSRATCMYR